MPSPQPVPAPAPARDAETSGGPRHLAFRFVAFLALWSALHGGGWLDLAVGALAAAGASVVSLSLLPPAKAGLALGPVSRLALAFPFQSLRAGLDVARRAFSPAMPLTPGIVACPTGLPAGTEREAFHAYMSLQPGTLPVAMRDDNTLLVHALDTGTPVATTLSEEEDRFCRLRGTSADG